MSMTSNRPYLIRAYYDWIVDNDCTPYLAVDAFFPGVEVPEGYISDGQIVLNVAPRAILGMDMSNELISFNTRFGGVPTDIRVPVLAVLGIYARENGQGMVFEPEQPPEPQPPNDDKPGPKAVKSSSDKKPSQEKTGKKASLRVIK